ncbi:lipid A biosynthesis lauroyl acyltransferase [Halopseudomonas salegens]|uniref:Lipid A biosynthesis acyltransferase n=1 Tax=Halopseudomonas salegens TaxID=1434072 RepID=A0A1H2GEE6_9GAMM|nr:lipid A biosynthesis lauroyl acyltransferase [Halopseudomonas salegens]SDU17852.1 KDO2-lipid IV(A) lauroyltransferase [Halopseudomonas salegens]
MARPGFSMALLHPRYWLLWLGFGLLWLLIRLPYRWLLGLGHLLGLAMLAGMRERREVARINLALCFPELGEAEREKLLRANFISSGIGLLETAMAWFWPPQRLARLAHVSGLEHLQQAQTRGQGVVLISLHFTTLEIGAALLGQRVTFDGMYREHRNKAFDYIQRRGRERHSEEALAIERDDVRGMLRSLRKGRVTWYAPDQDYGPKVSVFAPLFGQQAATVTATSTFARLGKAVVIPFTQHRRADGSGYDVVVHPPLSDFPSDDPVADATRINQWVEQAVLAQPEQYMWVHRRFKTRPEGDARPYAAKRKKRRRRS